MRFLDTNILLYSISTMPGIEEGRPAQSLLSCRDVALSVQVLQEILCAEHPVKPAISAPHDEAVAFIRTWRRFPTQDITMAVLDEALDIRSRFQLSDWDLADSRCRQGRGAGKFSPKT